MWVNASYRRRSPSNAEDLVAEIYRTHWEYNQTRIHPALKMPLTVFAEQIAE
jgi:hypothetical protein